MNLKDKYIYLKNENKNTVVIMKYGNFYRIFNDDTYIVWSFTKYKIHDNRIGFPDRKSVV